MKIDDGDKALLLLHLLPISFEQFKNAIFNGKECTVTLDEVQTIMRFKEFLKVNFLKIDDSGEVRPIVFNNYCSLAYLRF